MSIWTKLFGGSQQSFSTKLLLEGTEFSLSTQEEPFFQSCASSGQGALKILFTEYWPVMVRGSKRKVIGGGTRLLCARCFEDMPFSFQMALDKDGGGPEVTIAVGERLPTNLFGSAKKASCPWCHSPDGILLWDHPSYGDVTKQDMAALRELWHQRCLLWWRQNKNNEARCDTCGQSIPRGDGYHNGSQVNCQQCALKDTNAEVQSKMREKPDYCGTSELRRARNIVSGRWPLDRGKLI
jgi:hypothetical protein